MSNSVSISPALCSYLQEPLDSQAVSRLAGAFTTMHLRQGETVVAEGDAVDRCFMIEYGSIEVHVLSIFFRFELRSTPPFVLEYLGLHFFLSYHGRGRIRQTG